NTLYQVLGLRDSGELILFTRELPIVGPPWCEDQALNQVLREFHMSLNQGYAQVEKGGSVAEIHERTGAIIEQLSNVRVKALFWYSAQVAGQDVTFELLQRV